MEQLSVAIADDNERAFGHVWMKSSVSDKDAERGGKSKKRRRYLSDHKEHKQPDVVLLDLIMPKMDGLTVMEQINQDKNGDRSVRSFIVADGESARKRSRKMPFRSRRKLLYDEAV